MMCLAGLYTFVASVLDVLVGWCRQLSDDLKHPTGYRFVGKVTATVLTLFGLYTAFYGLLAARSHFDWNTALAEGMRVVELASSGDAGFTTAMQRFAFMQMTFVDEEPSFFWLFLPRSRAQPNRERLHNWVVAYFQTCTPSRKCGLGDHRINLASFDLGGAELDGADLHEADLRGTQLTNAVLRGVDLFGAKLDSADVRGADLTGVRFWTPTQLKSTYWDSDTSWPDNYVPPCEQSLHDDPCVEPELSDTVSSSSDT